MAKPRTHARACPPVVAGVAGGTAALLLGVFSLSGAACGSTGGATSGSDAASDRAADGMLGPDTGPTSPHDAAGKPEEAATDTGPRESGPPPSPSTPAIACTASTSAVYGTPGGLAPMTLANRGDVVVCAPDSVQTLAQVNANVASNSVSGYTATTGVNLFRIEYRTKRANGQDGTSSARVYLPQTGISSPMPLLVVGHPTDGMAPSCAPSMDPTSNANLALPWAGLGYAVIVPDYAGLGTQGVQGYVDNVDTAQSTMDGARALRKLMPSGVFDERVLAIGYSQGGGAVLSMQALASTYGVGGNLVGVIGFAPEWPSRLNSFNYIDMLQNPNELTVETGLMEPVVTSYREYAYFANYVGLASADDGFPASNAVTYGNAVDSICFLEFGAWVNANAPHVSDMIDPTLRTTLLSCAGVDGGADAGCVDPGKSYYGFLSSNILTSDGSGAPVLYIQGLADVIMPPASEAACNIQKMESDGLTPQVCTDALGQHQTIVPRNIMFAIQWGQALLAGTALPTCSAAGMPTCTP
jgi:pimeloyl-ACP methyl ester carboxylesterase